MGRTSSTSTNKFDGSRTTKWSKLSVRITSNYQKVRQVEILQMFVIGYTQPPYLEICNIEEGPVSGLLLRRRLVFVLVMFYLNSVMYCLGSNKMRGVNNEF